MKSIKQAIKNRLRPFYKTLFRARAKNKILKKENADLKYQLNYLEHHFDIGDMKPAMGVLREFQLAEVDFARNILDILEPYNLELYLEGGALLGAKRHRGFIPWDDDIDIAMARSDYNKLLQILKTDAHFVWIDSSQKSGYYSEYYDKLIRANPHKNIVVRTPHCMHVFNGTCLRDASNLEFFPNDFLKEEVTEAQYLATRDKFINFMRKKHSWQEIFTYYETKWQESGLYSLEPTSRIVPGLGNWDLIMYDFHGFRRYDDVYPLTTIEFEGRKFPCPNKALAILEREYGKNWRDYPKDIGIPHTLLDKNTYFSMIGEPLIDYKDV
jgi:lipopolysaccharide cholinephosphotransferase